MHRVLLGVVGIWSAGRWLSSSQLTVTRTVNLFVLCVWGPCAA